MTSSRPLLTSVAACLLLACGAHSTTRPGTEMSVSSRADAPHRDGAKLAERDELPLAVREALDARMARHGEQFSYLLANVVLLDYDAAAELAEEIVDEPPLGRPRPGDASSLNAMLPAAFFDYEDQLRARATHLAQAARAKDRAVLVAAFGNLAETCVACHAAYLHDELPAHADEP